MFVISLGGNLSSKIEQNSQEGKYFSEKELKRIVKHVAMVSIPYSAVSTYICDRP